MDFESDFQDRSVDFSSAKADITRLTDKYKRFDNEFLLGIHTFLRVSAHRGIRKHESLYLYKTRKRPDFPAFNVLYTFDDRKVMVRRIVPVVPEEDDPSQ